MNSNNNNNNNKKRVYEDNQSDETNKVNPLTDTNENIVFHKCNTNTLIDTECIICFDRTINSESNLLKLFHLACEEKKYKLIEKFCGLPESNLKTIVLNSLLDNQTPLHRCIKNGDINSTHMLLNQSTIDIFISFDIRKDSPFLYALDEYLKKVTPNEQIIQLDNDNETAAELVNYNDDLDHNINKGGETQLQVFKLLLFKMSSVFKHNTRDDNYLNPDSVQGKFITRLVHIFSRAMMNAINISNYFVLRLMMTTSTYYQTISKLPSFDLPIFSAISRGDIKIIKMMMKYGTSFNTNKKIINYASHTLCSKGFLTILKMLIEEYHVATAKNKCKPELSTLSNNDEMIVDEEIETITDFVFEPISDSGSNSLHYAVLGDNPNTLKYLLSLPNANKYLNVQNNNGSTPLLCACSKGNIECVKLLTQQENIDFLLEDVNGNTPIVYANYYKRIDASVELLKAISVKLSKLSDDYYVMENNKELVEKLIMEKQKWIITSHVEVKNLLQPNRVNIKSFGKVQHDLLKVINENIEALKDAFTFHKKLYKIEKLPIIEIKMDGFEHGSGVLRQWLQNVSNVYVGEKFLMKSIFDYNDLQSNLMYSYSYKEGYKVPINLSGNFLYLPYFTNVTELEIYQMRNFGSFLAISLLYSRVFLPISPVFFKVLLNEKLCLQDILPSSMLKMLREFSLYINEEFEDIELDFTVRSLKSDNTSETFVLHNPENYVQVTKENLNVYTKCLEDFYFKRGERETLLNSFKEGFYEIVPFEKIQHLTCPELVKLICSSPEFLPLEEWKKYTQVFYKKQDEMVELSSDDEQNIPVEIKWFWEYLSEIDFKTQLRLIEFISGSAFLPIGNLRTLFDNKTPFKIIFMSINENSLPTTTTCNFTLCLFKYSSKDTMFEKFNIALESFSGFQFV